MLVLVLLGSSAYLMALYQDARREHAAMESALELVANELAYQNQKLSEELISVVRREMERGNNLHQDVIPLAYWVRSAADSLCRPGLLAQRPRALDFYVAVADSVYRHYRLADALHTTPLDVEALPPTQRGVQVRLLERGALRLMQAQTVRLLTVPDTLMALDIPNSLTVPMGQKFETTIIPLWSASGFRPFERYRFRTDIGEVEPLADGAQCRLRIPTEGMLEEGQRERGVNYIVSIWLDVPGQPRRRIEVSGKFRVVRPCP